MTPYYEQYGHGPELVLVHGWGSHGGVWADIARALSADYRVTVPDLPGHGRSRDFLPTAYTPEVLAEGVRRGLSGPAVWIGWSMGGLVALAAAQRYPREVARLVLVGATPKYVQSADWPHAMSPTVLEQFARNLELDYAGTLDRFLTLQMAAGEDRAVLRRLRDEMFRYGEPPTAALQAGLRLLKEEDRRDALAGIAMPTLVMHGARDRLAPVGAARYLAQQLPQARLEIVPEAGHAPFLSHPEIFLEKLKGFIRD
ncbi:MAG: pimeloyl-ACP methyl ester esterase BioH [Gammaproteobacteria bacterium]|nr:pimeloyl-ACP methyl ester esterase BioH [Gammaproteobacteria bacterium]